MTTTIDMATEAHELVVDTTTRLREAIRFLEHGEKLNAAAQLNVAKIRLKVAIAGVTAACSELKDADAAKGDRTARLPFDEKGGGGKNGEEPKKEAEEPVIGRGRGSRKAKKGGRS